MESGPKELLVEFLKVIGIAYAISISIAAMVILYVTKTTKSEEELNGTKR